MPFFATRRIVEGLGLGLARRAARKLVPVVLTLGSGPSGFPRKLSGRRPKLPRQPRRGRVARARSRNFGAGSWPVGLPETTFRATAEASATAMANPRRRTRALRYFGAGGLARRASRNNFPSDGQSFCDSLPRARFRRFGAGGWPDGLPETSFRAMHSGGILDADSHGKPAPSHYLPGEASATAMANPRRRSRMLRYFGAGGWPVGLPETSFRATQRGGDLGGRRGICGPKPMSQHGRPRLSRATRPVAAMAVLSTRSGQMARSPDGRFHIVPYKEFISGQAEQFLGRLAKRMATLSRPASRSRFIKFINSGRFIKVEDKASGRNVKAGQPQ